MSCFAGCVAGIRRRFVTPPIEDISDRDELVAFLRKACASKRSAEYRSLYRFLVKVFRSADRDYDGLVGPEDFDIMVEIAGAIPRRFGLAPTSSEMFSSPAERVTRRNEMFKQINKDGKGMISFNEFLDYTYNHICRMMGTSEMQASNTRIDKKAHFKDFVLAASRTRRSPEYKKLYDLLLSTFVEADKDNDGKVNLQEFDGMIDIAASYPRQFGFAPPTSKLYKSTAERMEVRGKMFQVMDKDGDGNISFEEWLNFSYSHICEKAKLLDDTLSGTVPPVIRGCPR